MIAQGKVDPRPLVTGTADLDGEANAFEAFADPEKHAKILIDPRSTATRPAWFTASATAGRPVPAGESGQVADSRWWMSDQRRPVT